MGLSSTSAKLEQSKVRAHEQDVQLGQLRTELKSLENTKERLRSSYVSTSPTTTFSYSTMGIYCSLETSQQSTNKLTHELHALTLREAVLQEKSGEQAVQVSRLGAEVNKLNTEASAREEEYASETPRARSRLTIKFPSGLDKLILGALSVAPPIWLHRWAVTQCGF